MTSYLFILGRTPDLAFAELQTFLPDVTRISEGVATSSHTVPIEKLGGTIKIAEIIGTVRSVAPETLTPYIDSQTFGLSYYGGNQKPTRTLLEGIKTMLAGSGRHVRFVEARGGSDLSSVVIQKQHVQEYVIVKKQDDYVVGKTTEVQPFEEWDYGRPYADPKAGMLPPKVSRMAVNIADRFRDSGRVLAQKTLLDPFCGMGTILSEALVMGWNVVGGDQSEEILAKTRKNLLWLVQKYSDLGVTYRLHVSDAVHISGAVDRGTVDAIVTEPFMGAAQRALPGGRDIDKVKNTIKGLEKLYIGCLRDWRNLLKAEGVVMMALPMYAVNGKFFFVKKVIDMCETLGYTIVTGPIEYSRPQAIVKRVFYLFQKT
jgi:tRNA G10  N-methylase Trm11